MWESPAAVLEWWEREGAVQCGQRSKIWSLETHEGQVLAPLNYLSVLLVGPLDCMLWKWMCSLQHLYFTLTKGLGEWVNHGGTLEWAGVFWLQLPGWDQVTPAWEQRSVLSGCWGLNRWRLVCCFPAKWGAPPVHWLLAETALPCLWGQEQFFPVSSLTWPGLALEGVLSND